MATTLQSPGANVSVTDLSFYTPASPGTVPMIFVASAANKTNSSGVTAPGTIPANAGKVWTITSQLDLANTFGTPLFLTDTNGNAINGGEQNEYGLQAAYSLLGVSSKAYIVRSDIDLSQLTAAATVPTGMPVNGTYWLDTNNTKFGIYEWDADNKVFTLQTPLVINDDNSATDTTDGLTPKQSFGTKGAYAVVATSDNMGVVWYKNSNNTWVQVGSNTESKFGTSITGYTFTSTSWASSYPLVTSTGISGLPGGSTFTINGQTVTIAGTGTNAVATTINSLMPIYGVGAKVNAAGLIELYADITADGNSTNDGKIKIGGTTSTVGHLGFTAGTYAPAALTLAPHTQVPKYSASNSPSGSVYIKTTAASVGANWNVKLYNGITDKWSVQSAHIYSSVEAGIAALDPTGGGSNIAVGSLMIVSNYDGGTGVSSTSSVKLAEFEILRRSAVSPTTIVGSKDLSSFTISRGASASTTTYIIGIAETVPGMAYAQNTTTITIASINPSGGNTSTTVSGSSIVTAISAAGFEYVTASINSSGYLTLTHSTGGDINIADFGTTAVLSTLGFSATGNNATANLYTAGEYSGYTVRASNWSPLVFEALDNEPTTDPADGQIWYGSNLDEVDILYHNGTTWVGYHYNGSGNQGSTAAFPNSDPNGPIVAASQPSTQSDGTALVDGDIWIDSSSTKTFGQSIYVYNGNTLSWDLQDVTDHETPNGWVYADARWATSGSATKPSTIASLLSSNYLDPDAPEPDLYPEGTRLWNLRRSGFNVKKYHKNYIDIYDNNGVNIRYQSDPMDGSGQSTEYNTSRWVSASPNDHLGVGTFGRYAQRSFVVAALKAEIDTNISARDTDTVVYNLLACPGYPETIQNMIGLNSDRGYTAFVVGDTPFRLKGDGTSLADWGANKAGAVDNNEQGAVSYDEYMAMFYPSGYTNDNSGNYIVVPPSHMMLRTITESDQKSYQWFAPAGVNRGAVVNATAVGYVDSTGGFITTALPQNIRDVLAKVKVNPIATLNGVGIVNYGNYTRAHKSSALDRINVARLVAYLRRQLSILAQPFLFEPNDNSTRQAIKNAAESLFIELVGQRAVYDYIVVCDESNNTPARIDRSELWMDIAIEPVKAVEFIYIPLRLLNTGAIASGNLGAGFPGSTQ
jgi:hypothetical protein